MLPEVAQRAGSPREPWFAFLAAIDAHLTEETTLHCIGGFAIVKAFRLVRSTAELGIIAVLLYQTAVLLVEIAGKESTLHRKHNLYLEVVTVATAPENYESRLIALYPGCWRYLRLFALEPHDLALTKLERNLNAIAANHAAIGSPAASEPPSALRKISPCPRFARRVPPRVFLPPNLTKDTHFGPTI